MPLSIISFLIVEDTSFISQHGSDILALCLSATEADAARVDTDQRQVARTRQAAEMLSVREDGELTK